MPQFTTDIFNQFDKKWALLCAGNKENHNTMTISWGGIGYALEKTGGDGVCEALSLHLWIHE